MKATIHRVLVTRRAEKQLASVPPHIRLNLLVWVATVEVDGLEETRKIAGYHDEPLHGQRAGQRSIRLNRSYRAIYEVKGEIVRTVSVEEVGKHAY